MCRSQRCRQSLCIDHGGGGGIVIDDKERICTFNALATYIWYFHYALKEAFHCLVKDWFQILACLGWLRSWQYSSKLLVSL